MADAQKTTGAQTKEKMVTVRLAITRDEKGPVEVIVNDRSWKIPRGKDVKVPECVEEVLDHRDAMLEEIALREG